MESMTPSPRTQENYEKDLATPEPKYSTTTKPSARCSGLALGNTFIAIGIVIVVFGIVYGTAGPALVNKTINNKVVSCKASDFAKESFLDPYGDCKDCNPYVYSFHPYNVTNAEQVLQGAKAQLQELGPYAYRKRFVKKDVRFDGNEVSYWAYNYWTFDQTLSCAGCSPDDLVTVFDLGYLAIMNGAAGETNFLKTLLKSMPGAANETDASMAMKIQMGGPILLRLMYGYNSLSPDALKNLGTKAAMALVTQDLVTLMSLKMEGFDYVGMFKRLTVHQAAIGHPSILVGTAVGKNYLDNCVKGGLNDKCASCQGAQCAEIAGECAKCAKGEEILASNDRSCGQIEAVYASKYGQEEASQFVAGTCRTCALTGFCAAQIYGNLELTGFDWSQEAPPARFWGYYTQKTGCDGDKEHINDYVRFDNFTSMELYVQSNQQVNPSALELVSSHGKCKHKDDDTQTGDNVTCAQVFGSDGSAFKPSGVSLAGMPDTSDVKSRDVYVDVAKQNVTVYRTNEKPTLKGIHLVRYRPQTDILYQHPWNTNRGTGVPLGGLQTLSFAYGFLAYLSFPFFAWGEPSLLENVELTRHDGTKMTRDQVYDSDGQVKAEIREQYSTFLDVEPATGKAMRVRNRCQASIAINKSPSVEGAGLSDILFPKVQTEMVWPLFWGEQAVTISDHNADRFKSELSTISKTFLPVLIVGLVLGVAVAGFGGFHRLRASRTSKSGQIQSAMV